MSRFAIPRSTRMSKGHCWKNSNRETLNQIYRRMIRPGDLINRTIHKNRVVAFASGKAQ